MAAHAPPLRLPAGAYLGKDRPCVGGFDWAGQESARAGVGSAAGRRRGGVVVVAGEMPGPGMYGGPPDRKLRQQWGGQPKKDPLDTGDYLWDNRDDWKRVLDRELQEASQASPASPSVGSPAGAQRGGDAESSSGSGFLSLGRAMALDNLQLDLSRDLVPMKTVSLEDQVEQARVAAGERRSVAVPPPADAAAIKWRSVSSPTKRESKEREKSFSFKPGSYMKESTAETAEQEELHFQQMKNTLLLYTFGLGVCFSASAAAVYSPQVAISFGLGSLGSLIYVRMLSSSVESIGKASLGAAARGSLGQPRLLVPVVLVMAYNRWNAILVPEYGIAELQLIPMLLGFLTYKAATITQTFQDLLLESSPSSGGSARQDDS